MRQNEIIELLDEVSELIKSLEIDNKKADTDKNKQSLAKPKVKSALEHMRSVLDYMIHDIYDSTYNCSDSTNIRIYFPYSKSKKNYLKNLNSKKNKLRDLKQKSSTIYNLIESIQPFNSSSDWLYHLCDLTNINKHVATSTQTRKDTNRIVLGNNDIVIENSKNITITNSTLSGKTQTDAFHIDSTGQITENSYNVGFDIKEFNLADFSFADRNLPILPFLRTCHHELYEFQNSIYAIIDS